MTIKTLYYFVNSVLNPLYYLDEDHYSRITFNRLQTRPGGVCSVWCFCAFCVMDCVMDCVMER